MAREMIEESTAIQCPSLSLHLLGMKKVQQLVADPLFFSCLSLDDTLRDTFMKFYSFESKEKKNEALKALNNDSGHGYIIKPQREGGGHNICDENIAPFVQKSSDQELSGYIMMELIKSPSLFTSTLLRNDRIEGSAVPCVSELGIFGAFLADEKLLYERTSGHILRTKAKTCVGEGGIAAGYAYLDTPLLL